MTAPTPPAVLSVEGHTPGPWAVAKGSPHYIASDDKWVASTMGVRGEEAEANARLIAAAPDLKEALQLIVDTYGFDPSVDSSIWQTAFAALAKATAK